MTAKRLEIRTLILLLLTVLVGVPGVAADSEPGSISQAETDGYLQWLHSLEQTVAARESAGTDEANLLFPFDLPSYGADEARPYRHLAISKALGMMEEEYPGAMRERIDSPFLALSTARNYMNLSEYDSALVWFELADEVDKAGRFDHEISRERMTAALAAGDSLGLVKMSTNILGTSVLTGREAELMLTYRWLLVTRDYKALDLLIRKMESQPELLTDRLLFWHAYSLSWRREYDRSLESVRTLVRSGGLSRDLSEAQRAWVLIAVPDLLLLNEHESEARDLYEVLANSDLADLEVWGTHQVANLDFLNGKYLRASEGFQRVCEGKRTGSFQDHACAMANLTRELHRIHTEGKPYGTAAYYAR